MWTLEEFIEESNRIEGILRNPTQEEIAVHEVFLANREVTVADLESFVSIIQPGAVLRRTVGLDVRVGGYIAPSGGPEIEKNLQNLLRSVSAGVFGSYIAHIDYEKLHPFTDGNGRSGRALWLWRQNGYAPLGFLHEFYYQTLKANQ